MTKQPEDFKKKKASAKQDVDPIQTVDFHDHVYTVDMRGADDVDVMDALADARSGGDDSAFMAAFSLMLRGMLGDEYPRWKAEQRAVHKAHKDEDYEGDCECEGRLGAYVMQEFITSAGAGNS